MKQSIIVLLVLCTLCFGQSPTPTTSEIPSASPSSVPSHSPTPSPSPSCLPSICSDNNLCTIDTCENGTCVYTNITCYSDDCTSSFCDPAIGCVNTTLSCNRCLYPSSIECPYHPCKIASCDSDYGTCKYKDLDCGEGSCDINTGQCKVKDVSPAALVALAAICATSIVVAGIFILLYYRKSLSYPPTRDEIFYEEDPIEKSASYNGPSVGICVSDRVITVCYKDQTISVPLMLVSQEGRWIWTGKPGENARIVVEILRLMGKSDSDIRKTMQKWWGVCSPMEISDGKVVLEDGNALSFETIFEIILEYCLEKLASKTNNSLAPCAVVAVPSWFYVQLEKREKLKNIFKKQFKFVTLVPQGKIALQNQTQSNACVTFHGGATELALRTPYGFRYTARKVGPVDAVYAVWKKSRWNIVDQVMQFATGVGSRYPPNKFVAEISELLSCVTQYNGKSVRVDSLKKNLGVSEMNSHMVEFKNTMESFKKYEANAVSSGMYPPCCSSMKFQLHLEESAIASACCNFLDGTTHDTSSS